MCVVVVVCVVVCVCVCASVQDFGGKSGRTSYVFLFFVSAVSEKT